MLLKKGAHGGNLVSPVQNARLRELLFTVIPKIGPQPDDVCATALKGARL